MRRGKRYAGHFPGWILTTNTSFGPWDPEWGHLFDATHHVGEEGLVQMEGAVGVVCRWRPYDWVCPSGAGVSLGSVGTSSRLP